MSDHSVLVVCETADFADEVTSAVHAGRLGRLNYLADLPSVPAEVGRGGRQILLVQVTADTDRGELARVARLLASARPPVPTILIGGAEAEAVSRSIGDGQGVEFLPRAGLARSLGERLRRGRAPGANPAPAGRGGPDARADRMSAAGIRMNEQVQRVAPIDATILLSGEIGSGKTRAARLIHDASNRAGRPFLAVSCGALSATALEFELFGYVRNPGPSGTDRGQPGKLAEVEDGTLLLDDVDALSPAIQSKLLRAIESGVFEPIGSSVPSPMRARLIATSGRPLDQEVAAGRFRSDLYYRINVIEITVPPLRQRTEEIPGLAGRFVTEFAARCGREVDGISDEAVEALVRHDWPGNVRELRNVLERAVVLGLSNQVTLEDLKLKSPPTPRNLADPSAAGGPATLADAKRDAEQARIVEALRKHDNVRLYAARELGISRMTLYKKMYEYGLMERPNREAADRRSDDDAA